MAALMLGHKEEQMVRFGSKGILINQNESKQLLLSLASSSSVSVQLLSQSSRRSWGALATLSRSRSTQTKNPIFSPYPTNKNKPNSNKSFCKSLKLMKMPREFCQERKGCFVVLPWYEMEQEVTRQYTFLSWRGVWRWVQAIHQPNQVHDLVSKSSRSPSNPAVGYYRHIW